MTTKKIDDKGQRILCDYFAECERVDTYIATNDKEPLWDGHLYLFNSPEQKAERFVKVNGLTFYDLVNINQQIPTTLDGIKVDVWSGEHTMYEFLLGTGMGDTQYWGVYYSPDDVPLPYQNTDVSLIADDDGSWTWQTDGDNHGTTKKIIEKWYYFEASF